MSTSLPFIDRIDLVSVPGDFLKIAVSGGSNLSGQIENLSTPSLLDFDSNLFAQVVEFSSTSIFLRFLKRLHLLKHKKCMSVLRVRPRKSLKRRLLFYGIVKSCRLVVMRDFQERRELFQLACRLAYF